MTLTLIFFRSVCFVVSNVSVKKLRFKLEGYLGNNNANSVFVFIPNSIILVQSTSIIHICVIACGQYTVTQPFGGFNVMHLCGFQKVM